MGTHTLAAGRTGSERPSRLKGIETWNRGSGTRGNIGSERPSRLKGIETVNVLYNSIAKNVQVRKDLPV